MFLTRREILKSAAAATMLSGIASPAEDRAHGFKLGIFTDELTPDLEEALRFITSYNLKWCELRDIWGKSLMISPQENLDRAKKLLADYGVKASDIASPAFKWNIPGETTHPNERHDPTRGSFTEEDADTVLQKGFELAHFFGTPNVRTFSYWRVSDPTQVYPQVRDRLGKATELAKKNGIVLILENELDCNVGTGKELGRILHDINSPNLRGIWDPGNAAMLKEVAFPDGYDACKGMLAHVHLKDVRKNEQSDRLEWAPVGGGLIDFKGQFAALKKDNYTGTMSLETHYQRPDRNKVEATRESLEGIFKSL